MYICGTQIYDMYVPIFYIYYIYLYMRVCCAFFPCEMSAAQGNTDMVATKQENKVLACKKHASTPIYLMHAQSLSMWFGFLLRNACTKRAPVAISICKCLLWAWALAEEHIPAKKACYEAVLHACHVALRLEYTLQSWKYNRQGLATKGIWRCRKPKRCTKDSLGASKFAILLHVQSDLVLLSLVIDHLRNPTRAAEHHLHTDDAHHHDAALLWSLDVTAPIHVHAPRHHVTDPEAVKSYFDLLQTHPIRTTFLLLMLMTPGVHGTKATTTTPTTTTLLDPILLLIHHHRNHKPTHQPTLQHHSARCPSEFRTATVKILRLLIPFRSPSLTRMTSTSMKWWRRPMTPIEFDAWPSLAPITLFLYANHWPRLSCSSSTSLWTRCSNSWLNHTAPSTTIVFGSKPAKPPSGILPGPLHNPTYWTSNLQSKHKPSILSQRTCWPSRFPQDWRRNQSTVANTWAPTWSTTRQVGNQLPKFLLKTASARQLGQKTKPVYRPNTRVTGSSECPLRSQTPTTYPAMLSGFVPLSFTK